MKKQVKNADNIPRNVRILAVKAQVSRQATLTKVIKDINRFEALQHGMANGIDLDTTEHTKLYSARELK